MPLSATLRDDRIHVTGDTLPVRHRLAAIPTARWDSAARAWTFAATPHAAAFLRRVASLPIQFAPEVQLIGVRARVGERPREDALPFAADGPPAWRHQVRAAWWLADREAALLQYGMGCLAADSEINVNRCGKGFRMAIRDLVERELRGWPKESPTFVRGLKADGTMGLVRLVGVKATGFRHVLRLTLDNGSELVLTGGHDVVTPNGKVHAEDLRPGDAVLVDECGGRSFSGRERKARPYLAGKTGDGRRLTRDGYVVFAGSRVKGSPLTEHRVVASAMLGRALRGDEIVHHRNGDKTDNRPENLEILVGQQAHSRLHDLRKNLAGTAPLVAHVETMAWGIAPVAVYDLSVEDDAHTYVANGVVVGNTGKTRAALDALRIVGAHRVLVVCPLAVVPVWPAQARLHHDGHFTTLALDRGSVARRAQRLLTAHQRTPGPLLAAVNYDSAWRLVMAGAIARVPFDVVIYDECHRLKSPSANASVWAARLRSSIPRRWALSGTPLAHSPLDAYSVFRALDPGIFGTNFAAFRALFARMGGFQNRQVIGYQNEDEFRERYFWLTLAQGRDVLDLPPTLHVEHPIRLPESALRVHRQLKEEFVATLADGTEMSAPNALTRLLRLQQVSSGYLQEGDGPATELHTEKRDALAEFLTDLDPDEPVVVFCRFRHDLAAVHQAAVAARRYSYELSGARRELLAWQEATDGAVLACQIQSGSEGIDLTRACHAVFFSLGFSLSQYEQAQARVHRPGQTRPTTYHHLIAAGTIDRYVYRTLQERRDVIDAILRGGINEINEEEDE